MAQVIFHELLRILTICLTISCCLCCIGSILYASYGSS